MATAADVLVKMAGPALLWVGLRGNSMPALHPGYCMVARFARMAVKAGRVFMTHRATTRI